MNSSNLTSNFDFKIGGNVKETAMISGGIIFVIAIIVVIIYFSIKNSQDNGGSTAQALIGNKTGSFCTSNAMCASNKCSKYNICVL